MKHRSVKWLLAGLGVVVAFGVARVAIAAVRRGRPLFDLDPGAADMIAEDAAVKDAAFEAPVAEPELQPAS